MPSDDPPPLEDPPDEPASEHYVDAANRLERVIDVQIDILEGIDDKAEHVTRLVGLLLGMVLSVLSLTARLETVTGPATTPVTALAFGLGITGLFAAMVGAILTYLGSRMRVGLDSNVGLLLSSEEYSIASEEYNRRLLGTYGHNVRVNERVLATNTRRFQRTLVLLLVGVAYLSLSAVLSIGMTISREVATVSVTNWDARTAFLWTTGAVLLAATYVLSGRYLTLGAEEGINL